MSTDGRVFFQTNDIRNQFTCKFQNEGKDWFLHLEEQPPPWLGKVPSWSPPPPPGFDNQPPPSYTDKRNLFVLKYNIIDVIDFGV